MKCFAETHGCDKGAKRTALLPGEAPCRTKIDYTKGRLCRNKCDSAVSDQLGMLMPFPEGSECNSKGGHMWKVRDVRSFVTILQQIVCEVDFATTHGSSQLLGMSFKLASTINDKAFLK